MIHCPRPDRSFQSRLVPLVSRAVVRSRRYLLFWHQSVQSTSLAVGARRRPDTTTMILMFHPSTLSEEVLQLWTGTRTSILSRYFQWSLLVGSVSFPFTVGELSYTRCRLSRILSPTSGPSEGSSFVPSRDTLSPVVRSFLHYPLGPRCHSSRWTQHCRHSSELPEVSTLSQGIHLYPLFFPGFLLLPSLGAPLDRSRVPGRTDLGPVSRLYVSFP